MISFFEDIFPYERFPTEYECFKALKEYDNYVAVPWTQILNSHWLAFPGNKGADHYLKILSRTKILTENNFTVCQHDSFMRMREYFKHLNITKVFSTSCSVHDKIYGIEIIPISFAFKQNFVAYRDRDIPLSFVGSHITHPLRVKLRDIFIGDHFIYRETYHAESLDVDKTQEEKEYRDILERSQFAICPRGSVPSSVRFWECLQAGAIPVLISDDWKLPDWDWDNTIVRVKEQEIYEGITQEELLAKLGDITNIKEMRKNCLKAFSKFGHFNYRNYIDECLCTV